MKNEYIFSSDEDRKKVTSYISDNITVSISEIDKTPLSIVTYLISGNSESSAKKLSDLHDNIMKFSPLVLTCESSEYFNRVLYPLANTLERKLRKLLYSAASKSDNSKAKDSIKNLEEKTFGDIFELLFIDQKFIGNMKKRINADSKSEFNGMSQFSKEEIKGYLDSLLERTLWDEVLGEKHVPTLRSRFRDVQTYRNKVMHAHNIQKETYGEAKQLFKRINNELDKAIGELIDGSNENQTDQKVDVNKAINSAILATNLSTFSDALTSTSESIALFEISSQILHILESMQQLKESTVFGESIHDSQMLSIQHALKNFQLQLSKVSEGIKPSQQLLDILKRFNSINESLLSTTESLLDNKNTDDGIDNSDKRIIKTNANIENTDEESTNE